jgi:hypothetical protein
LPAVADAYFFHGHAIFSPCRLFVFAFASAIFTPFFTLAELRDIAPRWLRFSRFQLSTEPPYFHFFRATTLSLLLMPHFSQPTPCRHHYFQLSPLITLSILRFDTIFHFADDTIFRCFLSTLSPFISPRRQLMPIGRFSIIIFVLR